MKIMQNVVGYHYSSKDLEVGDVITSYQTKGATYKLVRGIYTEVAPVLFEEFGYAYPEKRMLHIGRREYEVTAEIALKGNLRHSLFVTMERITQLDFMKSFDIPLRERLELRNNFIRQQAELYFACTDPQAVELISDKFIVTKIL